MKATVQQEDLQLLGDILQERLVAQVPDHQGFQVKCAIKNDELMILTQHPSGVTVDTQQVFDVLQQALQWQFNYQTQRVQFFLRVAGEKIPYAKHFLDFPIPTVDSEEEANYESQILTESEGDMEDGNGRDTMYTPIDNDRDTLFIPIDLQKPSFTDIEIEEENSEPIADSFFTSSEESLESFSDYSSAESFSEDSFPDSPSADSILYDSPLDENESEEKFDPFANVPDKPKKRQLSLSFPPLPIVIGTAVAIALLSGGGVFFLHRGCVISECKELQIAQQFKSDYQQQIKRTKSEKDLLAVQQQLSVVVADLQKIPQWSPRYQESQQLVSSFSEQSTKISQVLKALETASSAQKSGQSPAKNLDELRNRQKLWRQAIPALEVIKPNNEFYGLVQANLPNYQNELKNVNQQLLKEETWVKKIASAKTSGEEAMKLQATAKSAADWQRVESNLRAAINTLKTIPTDSLGTEDARKLLADYQPKIITVGDRAKKEQLAVTFYQQATKAANQAKVYGNQNQWKAAVDSWQQAVKSATQVSPDTFYADQAKALIEPYTASLKQAQEQFQLYGDLTATRAELNNTCTSTVRICTFTIENQQINVRLTPEYDRLFQANNPEIQSHFQSLQEALKAIGQNSQLSVFIYNAQGQERYMWRPQ